MSMKLWERPVHFIVHGRTACGHCESSAYSRSKMVSGVTCKRCKATVIYKKKKRITSGSVALVCATIWTRWLVHWIERSNVKYIVQLQTSGVPMWLAPWSGDPGRTLKIENARIYKTIKGATVALGKARTYSPFKEAKIIEVMD